MINKIIHGDCLEVMKDIPGGSVDMILCDLPYGTTRNKWDSIIPIDELWAQYERVVKERGAIVLFAQTPFDKVLGASNLKLLRYEWIWEKNRPTGHLNAKKMPMKSHENILIFYKKAPVYNPQMTTGHTPLGTTFGDTKSQSNYGRHKRGVSDRQRIGGQTDRYPRSVQGFNVVLNRHLHPTQKPVALFEYLIKTYTNEGETVLDNCIGSGTTAIAAINTGRFYIGIEEEKEYVDISNARIDEARLKLSSSVVVN